MKQLIIAAAATVLLLSAGNVHAECAFPSYDEVRIPNGDTASKEEMIAAVKRVKDFQADMAAFRTCLDEELAAMEEPVPLEAVQFHDLRFNASVSTEEEIANKLNTEIRAFKARGAE